MNYRQMGRTGLKVSEVCLGTMTFGHGTEEDEAIKIVDLAFDAGVNFFDTADAYSNGVSETMLGNALAGRRRDVVVATKFFNPMGPAPTTRACRACTSCTQPRTACAGCRPTTSTSTTSTMWTRRRRWTRCCAPWMTW